MNKYVRAVAGASMLVACAGVNAHAFKKGDLVIERAWTRATARGQQVAAGYLEVRNAGNAPDRIIGAASPAAASVELHVIVKEGEVMKMRQVPAFDVPGGGKVELKPRGPHLMIIGIKRPFAKGERVPVTLRFEKAGELAIELAVEAIDSSPSPAHKH